MTARELAYQVLLATESSDAFADALLGRALEQSRLAGSDRALATILVYGTLARKLTLDHTLAALSSRPLERVEPPALVLLRMGLFQIAFLDRVPAYAAVDTSVRLARHHVRSAAGFVNALLRRAAREGLRPCDDADAIMRLSVLHSHPRWLVDLWVEELGHDAAVALLAADNETAPTVLRALADREHALTVLRSAGVRAEPATRAPQAIAVGPVSAALEAAAGLAVPQGEASQLAVLFAGVTAGERVLDACAAPGGKTAYLASLVGPRGTVTAVDPAAGAGRRIAASLERARVAGVEIIERPLADLGRHEPFDLVFVDAPCSGLGTLRQHPEIRWRREPDDITELAARQREILQCAADRVRPGGRLVYATCTVTRAENDGVVEAVLTARRDLRLEADARLHPALADVVGSDGRLRTFPHRHDTDGFFAARLVRRH